MAAGAPARAAWQWFPRDVERDIESVIERNRTAGVPTWLYIRGRRQVGKTATVRRIGARLAKAGVRFAYVCMRDDNLEQLSIDLGSKFPTLAAATRDLERRIMDGEFVAIDEIQESTRSFQQLLQRCVDNVKQTVLEGEAVRGGLIVLGSKPAEADAVLVGAGAPLWQRFESPRTILPFLSYETAALFAHFGVTDARRKVDILLLTGGYPGVLKKLADDCVLRNTAALPEMMYALVKSGEEHINFLRSDEFPAEWAMVAEQAVARKVSPGDVVRALSKGDGLGQEAEIRHKLALLETRYGVIRLVQPIIPVPDLVAGPKPLREHYERHDPRWLWFANVMQKHQPAGGEHDVRISVTDAHVSSFSELAGAFMERLVRQAIADRQRFDAALPLWRPGAGGGPEAAARQRWGDVHKPESTAIVLEGKFVNTTAEIDAICVYMAERHVVFVSCKLDAAALRDELRPMGGAGAAPVGTTVGGAGAAPLGAVGGAGSGGAARQATRLATHVRLLQEAAKRALDPAFAACLPAGMREIVKVLEAPDVTSLAYVACGLTDEVAADLVRGGATAGDGSATTSWFADFNEMWEFPASKRPRRP
jgi:hypothetical protein